MYERLINSHHIGCSLTVLLCSVLFCLAVVFHCAKDTKGNSLPANNFLPSKMGMERNKFLLSKFFSLPMCQRWILLIVDNSFQTKTLFPVKWKGKEQISILPPSHFPNVSTLAQERTSHTLITSQIICFLLT